MVKKEFQVRIGRFHLVELVATEGKIVVALGVPPLSDDARPVRRRQVTELAGVGALAKKEVRRTSKIRLGFALAY